MIPVTTFAGKTVAVFGLGGSGLASARALKAGGAYVVCWDDSPGRVAEAEAAGLATGDLRAIDWRNVAALVLSPGVPLTHPKPHWSAALARDNNVEVIGDIELFCRERAAAGLDCPFVAITGTNGKSTTTALTAHLLRAAGRDVQMGGNIGVPILALEPFKDGRIYVIEVSSYQVDLAPSLKPTVGVLLNISEDHLDRHGTMANYAALKVRVPAAAEPGGIAVIGIDDELSRAAADRVAGAGTTVVRISASAPAADLAGIGSLRGAHNAQNAAAAIAVARHFGVDAAAIRAALATFPGLPHRMEEVGRLGRVLYVNDSKATNADSAARALASFNDIFWIAGGKPKSGGITSLAGYFPRIRKAYLIGEAAKEFAATLDGKVPYEMSGVMAAAIEAAARDAGTCGAAEPVVLLSPACASFDQYRNFEARGTAFRDLVLALPGIEPKR
jgi:UDP-N-acetylmuramoylalanine--D-glutamate ligase